MLKKAIGMNEFLDTEFQVYEFQGAWLASFGTPEQNFRMMITGLEKNGKTDFAVKLTKYLSSFGKVYYNSHEEGKSKTLQETFERNKMKEVAGKVMLLHKEPFDDMLERLAKKGSPRFVVLDSLDYMELTEKQFKILVDRFPRKSIIMLAWCDNNEKPLRLAARLIAKRVDIVVKVRNGTAYPTSRFGGNQPLKFWDRQAPQQNGQQLTLM